VSEEGRSASTVVVVIGGLVIGAIETVLACALAALVFGAFADGDYIVRGVNLFLGAAVVTLALLAWLAGPRGVVGSLQETTAAVVAIVAANVAVTTFGSFDRSFLSVVAATLVITILSAAAFLTLGALRRGNLIRFVPYPVVGGFIAGIGWLLVKGGVGVAAHVVPAWAVFGELTERDTVQQWLPALGFGLLMLLAVRIVKRPWVIPAMIVLGFVAFGLGLVISQNSLQTARSFGWTMYGPFDAAETWQPWTLRAITGADWSAVIGQWAGIIAGVLVAVIVLLFTVSGSELELRRDLDTNRELRDAGVANAISGAVGGIPGYHALGLTALAKHLRVNAKVAGLIAAAVPLAAVAFGASVIEFVPRLVVGGVLVFLGLTFILEWVWDRRRSLPPVEYGVVLVILAVIVGKGFLPGVVVGLVLAVVLFAVSYGRIELVREVAFGDTYHSNVDRPPAQRAALRQMGDRVEILRVNGFVFFGSANGLLERIRKRVEASAPRFLVIDLRRVTGVDSSAVVSFVKVVHLAGSAGSEVVFTGASDQVRRQLARGGVLPTDIVRFETDLDRGLQWCEEGLLAESAAAPAVAVPDGDGAVMRMPPGLDRYMERVELAQDTTLLHQDEAPGDVFVLESGRLRVEAVTAEGVRMRLRTLGPGVVVGEVSLYTGVPRTADVVTETPAVVLRLGADAISRIESEEPELAAALHRWLAWTLADRLGDTLRSFDAMLD
jgi:SulP family sulfate permease